MLKTVIMKGTCIALVGSISFAAHAVAQTQRIEIPPGELAAALQALAKQADVDLVYQDAQTRGLLTAGVSGEMSPQEAIVRLLEGTPLEVRSDKASGALLIAPPQTSPPSEPLPVKGKDAATSATGEASNQRGQGTDGAQKKSFWDRFRLAQLDSTKTASDGSVGASATASAGDEVTRLEEIIVTAQKRAERLQDVPISISVLAGSQLDRSTAQGISEALNRVPGVSALTAAGGNTLLSVRGVTASAANFTGSSPIAYYLDYVPFSFVKSAIAPDSSAYDLQQVEVLRGPQGTLYGASAQNGVMRVLTHPADLSQFEVKARASVASTDSGENSSRIDSALNVPIVADALAARMVVGYQDLGGWIDRAGKKDANSGEVLNARLRLDAQPTDALTLGFSSWLSRSDYDAGFNSPDGRTMPSLILDPIDNDFDTYGLKIAYDFGAISLTSTSGYLDFSSLAYVDYALIGLPNTTLETRLQSKSFAQEIVLQSTAGTAWRWSIGGMYRDARDRLYQFRRQYAQLTDYRDTSESVAVFGELTRLFLDGRFELTGGLRYFEDEVSNQEYSRGTSVVVTPAELIRSEAKFDKLSPRVVLTWHPTDQLTAYTSYSEGFRSGFPQNGPVIVSAPQFPPLKADNLKNYEVGAKSSFLQGALNLEAAVFYIDWQDIQQTLAVNAGTVANPVNVSALVNGESASGVGVEMALNAMPMDGLTLGVNFSWNDLNMDKAVLSAGGVLFNAGDRLIASPEYVAGASAEYGFPISSGKDLRLWASANYTSELDSRAVVLGVGQVVSGDSILLGRAGLSLENGNHWSATLFVDNVLNEDGAPIRAAGLPTTFDTRIRPRTIGLQFEYRY